MTKLFISYAHLDSGIVLKIVRQLQEENYDVWIDKYGIEGGDLWASEIVKGIRGCDIFLLFVSSNSVRSSYVRRELDVAAGGNRKIIHVMIEDVEIPEHWVFQLAGLQYINYRSPDWYIQLLEALGENEATLPQKPQISTGKLKNPYSSLPVLELVERSLIFSNREKELQEGIKQLKNHRLLVVTGMPGIGKSSFVRALLDSRPADTPEPFWYNFQRQRSSGNTLGVLLDRISGHLEVCLKMEVRRDVMAFRDSKGGNASVNDVDVLIDFLNYEKPVWLVFDNLETVLSPETNEFLDEGLELLFDSLKNNTHNAKIIITNPFVPVLKTGEPFLEAGIESLTLEGINDASAIEFLRAYSKEDISEDELAPLIRETNGHPFVLARIAHYLQTIGVPVAMENLQGGLEEVNEWFGKSLKQDLSTVEFNALQSLTVLNRELLLSGLSEIANVQRGIIIRIREKGLLQTNDSGRFWLHNIVRSSLKPTEPDAVKKLHLRAMDFYRRQPMPSLPQSIEDCTNLLEWHYHAVEAGDVTSAYAALYSTGLENQLMRWNEFDLLARLCEQTFAVVSRVAAELSNIEQIKIYHTLGNTYFLLGDYSKSIKYLDSGLQLLQFEPNDELKIRLMIDLSEAHNGHRDFKAAMDLCDQVVQLLANVNNDALQAKFLHLRGIVHRDQGIQEQAIDDLEQALKIYKKTGDLEGAAGVTVELGIFYYYQNQIEKAAASYRDAIISYQAVDYVRGLMIARYDLGDVMLQMEDYESAIREFQLAFDLAKKGKFGNMELSAGLFLAEAQIALSNLDDAQRTLDSVKTLLLRTTSLCFLGQELALLATIQMKYKNQAKAQELFLRAFSFLKEPVCQYEYARANLVYAAFLKEHGQIEKARDSLILARNIFAALKNDLGLHAVDLALTALNG